MSYDVSKLQCVKTGAGGVITARCPACAKHGMDKTGNHLSIRPNGEFNCVIGSKSDAQHNLVIRAHLKGTSLDDIEYIEQQPKIAPNIVYPDSVLDGLLKDYTYWVGRGMKVEVLESLECGLAPKDEKGPLSGRSVFPLRNPDGQIVAWTGRMVIANSLAKKWKHFRPVSRVVWPWRVSGPEIERTKTAVLIESPGDTVACMSFGIKPVICLFGLNLFDLTVATLVGAGVKRVFVSLNRDADARKGQAAADKIARRLSSFVEEVRVRLPDDFKDWGECAEGGEKGAAELARFRAEVES